jgi:hypothetical protein
MTVDQVDTEDVLGVVPDEDGGKVLNMSVINRRLGTVIAQGIVSELEIVGL